jgi:hypothetical protein
MEQAVVEAQRRLQTALDTVRACGMLLTSEIPSSPDGFTAAYTRIEETYMYVEQLKKALTGLHLQLSHLQIERQDREQLCQTQ